MLHICIKLYICVYDLGKDLKLKTFVKIFQIILKYEFIKL